MVAFIPFITGYLLDLILGDPSFIPHPIRGIGLLINKTETLLRYNNSHLKLKGLLLFLIVTGVSYSTVFFTLKIFTILNIYIAVAVEAFIIFQMLATKSLFTETNKVYKALCNGDIELGKKHLSYLVSRDCENMKEEDIIRSTIETISENIVDGITSPLFFIFLGGAPLGMFYKAVNTLDSMVGYKNSKYIDFGFFSAKLDDIFNFIPARITSFIIILAAIFLNKDYKQAYRVLIRDRNNHSSPNSGYSEAPVAGALGIQLGGKVSYFGTVHNKPTMGDPLRTPTIQDIKDTHKIMYLTSFLTFIILTILGLGTVIL